MEGVVASARDGEHVVLARCSSIVIRPLVAGDEPTIDAWFAARSPETRFALPDDARCSNGWTAREAGVLDHRDHEAITALASDEQPSESPATCGPGL